MQFKTTDLCDSHEGKIHVVAPLFRPFGKNVTFSGKISTVRIFNDNVLVRNALSGEGHGKVLVVDGGGSLSCALVGDQLAAMAHKNGWNGIVVNGCIRDSQAIGEIEIGIRALATHPLRSIKKGEGETDVPVTFGGVTFLPGHFLYADEDGVIVSPTSLI